MGSGDVSEIFVSLFEETRHVTHRTFKRIPLKQIIARHHGTQNDGLICTDPPPITSAERDPYNLAKLDPTRTKSLEIPAWDKEVKKYLSRQLEVGKGAPTLIERRKLKPQPARTHVPLE